MRKKKILAGVMSFAMVMSVFFGVSANKSYAADEEIVTTTSDTDAEKEYESEMITVYNAATYSETESDDNIEYEAGPQTAIESTSEITEDESTPMDAETVTDDDIVEYDSMETYAGQLIELNSTNFPDERFRTSLKFNEAKYINGVYYIDPSEITEINLNNPYGKDYEYVVKSLKGIEYFYNLEELSFYDNDVTTVDLSKNTKLTLLDCSGNNLSKLDVSNNTKLTYLNCYNNNLSSLDVSKNSRLSDLYCDYNNISQLDISNNTQLKELLCEYNNLSKLDVSNNTKLTKLWCGGNDLTQLDVSKNTQLEELDCGFNNLSKLDVTNNTKLTILRCYENNLSQLDISKNTQLETLNCSHNNLSQLNLSKNSRLSDLYCYHNNISQLDISKNTQLTSLDCKANNLSVLDVTKNTKLESIHCTENNISQLDVSNCSQLKHLDCDDNNISQLDVSKNPELLSLFCDANNLTSLDVSRNKKLESMGCSMNSIHTLVLCDSLTGLQCDVENVQTIDFDKYPSLSVNWVYNPEKNDRTYGRDMYIFILKKENGKLVLTCNHHTITGGNPYFYASGFSYYPSETEWKRTPVVNEFRTDGVYTYYIQADGTAMMDRLTYHPDGHPQHIIYFDENGHEVFSDFAHVKRSIAGDAVDDYCFFNVYGYIYVDVLTYDKEGKNILYANPYGVLEHTGWFQFSDGGYGYANADATLMTSQHTYDWNGNLVYMEADGHIRGTGDGRNLWPK